MNQAFGPIWHASFAQSRGHGPCSQWADSEMWDSDLHLSVTDRCESCPTFQKGVHGETLNQVFALFWRRALGNKLRIKLESGFRSNRACFFRTKPRPSPLQPMDRLWKCGTVTCTCLSQTGASPDPHSHKGGPLRIIESSLQVILAKCCGA